MSTTGIGTKPATVAHWHQWWTVWSAYRRLKSLSEVGSTRVSDVFSTCDSLAKSSVASATLQVGTSREGGVVLFLAIFHYKHAEGFELAHAQWFGR